MYISTNLWSLGQFNKTNTDQPPKSASKGTRVSPKRSLERQEKELIPACY